MLNEPPQQFTIGFPDEYGDGVDERWKDRFGVWVIRTPFDDYHESSGFYALLRNLHAPWLHAELALGGEQVQVPLPRQRVPSDRYQLRGTAPRPLERARIVLAEDGQILIDKARKFQEELGQWTDPEAFLAV